jgi:phosphoserine phosphatase
MLSMRRHKANTLRRLAEQYDIAPMSRRWRLAMGRTILPMLKARWAGHVAYHAKPKVNEQAEVTIRQRRPDRGILCIL